MEKNIHGGHLLLPGKPFLETEQFHFAMDARRVVVAVAAAAIGYVAGVVVRTFTRHRQRHEAFPGYTVVKIPDRVLNRIVAMIPDEIAIGLHARRRTVMRDDRDGYVTVFYNPTPRLHYARLVYVPWENAYTCRWVSSTSTDTSSFDHKGRFLNTGRWEPFMDNKARHCSRFALQRMCHRLVQRTRRRIQCRRDLEPYLIPDLVHIITAYC